MIKERSSTCFIIIRRLDSFAMALVLLRSAIPKRPRLAVSRPHGGKAAKGTKPSGRPEPSKPRDVGRRQAARAKATGSASCKAEPGQRHATIACPPLRNILRGFEKDKTRGRLSRALAQCLEKSKLPQVRLAAVRSR